MLEEAYLSEANIKAATKARDEIWSEFMKSDISSGKSLYYGFRLADYNFIIEHYSIMFECHGGC